MSTNFAKPTYEELLKIVKDQESEIHRLLKKELSATNLEFYFKESSDLLCIAGTDGFFKEINPAFIKILGYTKQELLGMPFIELVHPADVAKSNDELKQLGQGISSLHFENRFLKKNGENVCIQWTTSVDSSREIIYAIGRDITGIKKAQNDLLESEVLLENAQKISKIGSWEFNYSSQKMIWSNELYSIYELEKKDNQDLFQEYVNRFSKTDVNLFLDRIKQSEIDRQPFELEQCAMIGENKTKWLYGIVYPIVDEKGTVVSLRGNTQDITEKRQIEEELNSRRQTETESKLKLIQEESNSKFKNYIENAPDGIFVADENGNFVEVNDAVTSISGYTKEELLTFSMMDLTYTESINDLEMCFNRVKTVGGSKGEFKTIHKSGEIRWSCVDSVKLSETRFMGFIKDITEIKRANELLVNTFERITDAFVALDNNWCYTYMNKKAGEIFGCNPKEIIGKHIWTEFPEGIGKPFYDAYHQAINEQKYIYLEEHYEPYDLWFENHIYPSSDGLSVFFRDITTEKIAKNTIENNERYFRALVENNEDIITVLDENLRTIFRSPASQRITGYTNEEFTKISDLDYYHPDYLKYMQEMVQKTLDNPGIQNPVLFQVRHKNGNYIWLKGVLNNLLNDSSMKGIVANLRDVTDSKLAQELIEQREKRFRALVENNDGIITIVDEKLKVLFRSPSSLRVTGYTDEEFDAIDYNEYFHPDYLEYVHRMIRLALNNPDNPIPVEFEVKHKNGNYISLQGVLTNLLHDDSVNGIIVNLKDVTESKKAQDIVEQREKRFFALIENAESIISLVDKDKNSLFRSASSARLTGWTDEEFDQLPENEFFHSDCLEYIQQLKQKIVASPGVLIPVLFQVKCKSGKYVWLEGNVKNMFHDKNLNGLISNLRDVTESKLANELLVNERNKFAKIAAASPGLIYSMRQNIDGSICYPYASQAIEDIYGFPFEEIENNPDKMFARIHPEDIELVIQKINKTKAELIPLKGIYRYLHPSKGLVWHDMNSLPIVESEGTVICHGVITDITDRIEAEQKLNKVNRLYLFISQINQMIVRTTDKQLLFRETCTIAVETGKFRMAWIGLLDENTNKIIPVMIAGEDNGYLSILKTVSKDDIPEGRGPAGRALREGKYVVCNDIENDLQIKPWKEEALSRNFNSLISLPIKKFGKTIGLFTLYSREKNFFDAEEIALLEEATGDVSFALEVMEKEILRKKAEEAMFQSENRYHTLTEVSPVGIFRTDAEGLTTYVNPSWCKIAGLSFENALGNDWLSAVHKEDLVNLSTDWENAAAKKEKSFSEYRFIHKDGSISWVMGQAIPEKNTEGKIVGYVGTITDITERKDAENLIIKEKQLSETIINNLPGIFYLYDESGKFVKWNKNFEQVTGYESCEIEKMNPLDFFDVEEKERIRTRIRSVFEDNLLGIQNRLPGIEVEFYTKNKNKIPYFIHSLAIEYEGESCIFGMGLDLTERKKAEEIIKIANERFERIALATNDAISEVDLLTGSSWNNKTFIDLFNFGNNEGNKIDSKILWRSKLHPDDRDRVIKKLEETYRGTATTWSDEFRFQKADGTYGDFYDRAVIMRDESGKPIRYIGSMLDVTERKRTEEKTRIANNRFETISLATNDAIFELDFVTGKSWHNKIFKDLLNSNGDDLSVDENRIIWRSKLHPKDRDRVLKNIEETYSGNSSLWSDEFRFQKPDGNYGYFYQRAAIVRDDSGKIVRFIGSMLDVTDLKKAEEDLLKMHEKLGSVFDAIPDILFEVDFDGRIYSYHSIANDLQGRHSGEFIGKTFSEVLPPDAANLVMSALNEASENGFSSGRQYTIEMPTGKHWFELSIALMQESEDQDTHFICLSREITDAKKGDEALLKSEERYRGLLNNLDAGVVVHSSDTSVIMSNQKASELLGLKVEQMLGKEAIDPEWKFLNEDGSSMQLEWFPVNQIANTKQSIKNFTVGINRPFSNDIVWLLVNGYPLFDTKGELAEIVISFLNITERKLMEIEIIEGRKQAESANKAKTDFLANMSHEIRTPLNGIIGFTHLLMKSNLEKNQSEYMSTINESATSLLEIVNDVLDFSKIESGKLELNIDELDLFKLTHQVIDLFKYQAQQKNIDLILQIDKEVPQFILADSVRLKQILVNLLSNALKFTNVGKISMDINAITGLNEKSSTIKFSVKDTGIGIKGNNNAKIFQSFVQEDNSTNRKFGGTGLGLAISNQLLALMNSKLNLISKYGEGSDFFFEIDFKKTDVNKKLNAEVDNVNTGDAIIALQIIGHKKVLIVEDNKINMLLAKTLVKRLISDCIIREAKDGNEAVELYKKERPDIILMDIQMPNKNGYEATMEIRQLQDSGEIPIIAITAGIMADDKEKCLEAGLNDYLSKPIIESDLQKMLFKWFDK